MMMSNSHTTLMNTAAFQPSRAVQKDPEASKRHEENMQYCMFYMGFLMAAGIGYQSCEDVGLSTFLTLSVAIQLFALICLMYQVQQQKGVQGISVRSLIMQCFVYGLRLSSSTWLKGYIPTDATGDGLYQALDLATLGLAVYLISRCRSVDRSTYQEQYDTLDIRPVIMACCALAVMIHPDLNDRPLFDTLWTASLYIDSVAMLPQLWMMARNGGAHVFTSHYVAAMALSRAVNFVFWFHGYPELAVLEDEEGELGSNLAGYFVVGAHVVQLVLMADFLWCYAKALCGDLAHGNCARTDQNSSTSYIDL